MKIIRIMAAVTATVMTFAAVATESPAGDGSIRPANRPAWPSRCFAPYVDVCLWPTPDFDKAAADKNLGVRYFVLAFVVAAGEKPCWGGQPTYPVGQGDFHQTIRTKIEAVRKQGADVMISCGGANGVELAQAIKDVAKLQQAYQSVIDAYDLTAIDFDIEGAAVADRASIDRRSQAIAGLQKAAAQAKRPLTVWFTLPVLPSGLTADGIKVLESAVKAGVRLDGVNIMCMDYGDGAAPNPQGKMGAYAIQAGNSLHGQLQKIVPSKKPVELWAMIGLCPMIGQNDTATEVFTVQDAREVAAFGREKKLGLLAMWSFNRDQANPKGKLNYAEGTSSSIVQEKYDFCKALRAYVE